MATAGYGKNIEVLPFTPSDKVIYEFNCVPQYNDDRSHYLLSDMRYGIWYVTSMLDEDVFSIVADKKIMCIIQVVHNMSFSLPG